MFKIKDFVPSVYYDESRDFQLFCNLLETVINSSKNEYESITNLYDPSACKAGFLESLSSIYNYKPQNVYTNGDMRKILSSYNELIKNKGSYRGIEQAIKIIFKLNNVESDYDIMIINAVNSEGFPIVPGDSSLIDYDNSYIIRVGVVAKDFKLNKNQLAEFINMVKPVGYKLEIYNTLLSKVDAKINIELGISEDETEIRELEKIKTIDETRDTYEIPKDDVERQEIVEA